MDLGALFPGQTQFQNIGVIHIVQLVGVGPLDAMAVFKQGGYPGGGASQKAVLDPFRHIPRKIPNHKAIGKGEGPSVVFECTDNPIY